MGIICSSVEGSDSNGAMSIRNQSLGNFGKKDDLLSGVSSKKLRLTTDDISQLKVKEQPLPKSHAIGIDLGALNVTIGLQRLNQNGVTILENTAGKKQTMLCFAF